MNMRLYIFQIYSQILDRLFYIQCYRFVYKVYFIYPNNSFFDEKKLALSKRFNNQIKNHIRLISV